MTPERLRWLHHNNTPCEPGEFIVVIVEKLYLNYALTPSLPIQTVWHILRLCLSRYHPIGSPPNSHQCSSHNYCAGVQPAGHLKKVDSRPDGRQESGEVGIKCFHTGYQKCRQRQRKKLNLSSSLILAHLKESTYKLIWASDEKLLNEFRYEVGSDASFYFFNRSIRLSKST